MIADAMFYGTEGTEDRPVGIKVGPINFTLGQLFISLAVGLIVAPPNLLIITLFKRAKPKASKDLLQEAADADSKKKGTFLSLVCCGKKKRTEGDDTESGEDEVGLYLFLCFKKMS